jgi:hypothetical protein
MRAAQAPAVASVCTRLTNRRIEQGTGITRLQPYVRPDP